MENCEIERVWLTDSAVWIHTTDGREACERFDDYQRLKCATQAQRGVYETDKYGIHWPELDEDLCFEGFFKKKETNPLYSLFMKHPELNAAAIARRMGMSQSLFAQYVSGIKKPSAERMKEILHTVQAIGKELQEETF